MEEAMTAVRSPSLMRKAGGSTTADMPARGSRHEVRISKVIEVRNPVDDSCSVSDAQEGVGAATPISPERERVHQVRQLQNGGPGCHSGARDLTTLK